MKDKGVELAETNLSEDASKAVADAKQAILDGKVEVPENLNEFLFDNSDSATRRGRRFQTEIFLSKAYQLW